MLNIASAVASSATLPNKAPVPPRLPAPAVQGPRFTEIGKGIFAFLGGYQSVVVEFDHFVVVIAWLPTAKTVVEADMLQPWINPAFGGNNGPHPFLLFFDGELKRLKLDYRHFVTIHAPPMPPLMERSDLETAVQAVKL